MSADRIDKLVEETHALFSATSLFEVYSLNKQAATEFLNEIYDDPDTERIDQYLQIIERLRSVIE